MYVGAKRLLIHDHSCRVVHNLMTYLPTLYQNSEVSTKITRILVYVNSYGVVVLEEILCKENNVEQIQYASCS